MKWYYETGGEQQGPVDTEQLLAMLADGDLDPDNKVWHKGMDAWTPASEVDELSVDSDEEEEEEVSAVDNAMAALAAVANPSAQSSSYDDDSYSDSYDDTDYSSPAPADHGGGGGGGGGPANPFGALTGGLQNLTGGGGGGLFGGLMSAASNREAAGAAVRDKPIPKTAAEVKHDFIETRGKVKTAWNTQGSDKVVSDAARQRLDALITAWKMSHTKESDYSVVLSNFEEELVAIKVGIRKSWMGYAMLLGGLITPLALIPLFIKMCN